MKRRICSVFGILAIVTGVGMLAYPVFADRAYQKTASHLQKAYADVTDALDTGQRDALLAGARDFNAWLSDAPDRFHLSEQRKAQYQDTLDISGTGIMGTLTIPDIDVCVPVYHGDGDAVLQAGAGHMEGTSFPTGEAGTHSVIAAHTGMASAKFFTDLDKLKEGSRFQIEILGEVFSYSVCRIQTVLPKEVESLAIDKEKSLITLVTCTPIGANTHRLLVTGERVQETFIMPAEAPDSPVPPEALIACGTFLIIISLFILTGKKAWLEKKNPKKEKKEKHLV